MNIALSPRWRTILMALGAGAGPALAHPPFGLIPGLLGFSLLAHLLDGADPARPLKSAFWRGWLAGCAYFFISTWWVGEAFLVDIAAHGWQAPFAVGFLAAGLALLWGAGGLAYRWLGPKGPARVLGFAAVFALVEWLRGHILTGFPWDLPGETWRAGGLISQTASVIGVYGLSFVTLAIATSGVVWLGDDYRQARIAATGAALSVLAVMAVFGAVRLAGPTPPPTGLAVRVVQANIDQASKWSPESFRAIYEAYLDLTRRPAAPGTPTPQVILWPEGAIPADARAFLAPGTWTRTELEATLRPGQVLLMGAARSDGPGLDAHYFNSLIAIRRDPSGLSVLGDYDKHRLVPFGEYMPMDSLMGAIGFKALVHVGDGFTPGPRPRPLTIDSLPPLQPLICYESLFPALLRHDLPRPAWIANVSNDAWFGRTSGPWQHLNIASYRAIEEGVPMIRATPTGVSAVIDSRGRTLQRLGQGVAGVIDAQLPRIDGPTPYRTLNDWAFWGLIFFGFASVRPWRRATNPLT